MRKQQRKIIICLLVIAAFVSFLPLAAHAYTVNLTSFQTDGITSGEIYGSGTRENGESTSPFFFCLETQVNVGVPGTYNVTETTLTDNFLRAAWLMNNYSPTWNGAYSGYNFLQTGEAVQYAIWKTIGETLPVAPSAVITLADTLFSLAGTQSLESLTYLQSSYYRMNLTTLAGAPVQDLIGGGPSRVVPIPAAVWLLGTGLIGLVGIRRRMVK